MNLGLPFIGMDAVGVKRIVIISKCLEVFLNSSKIRLDYFRKWYAWLPRQTCAQVRLEIRRSLFRSYGLATFFCWNWFSSYWWHMSVTGKRLYMILSMVNWICNCCQLQMRNAWNAISSSDEPLQIFLRILINISDLSAFAWKVLEYIVRTVLKSPWKLNVPWKVLGKHSKD